MEITAGITTVSQSMAVGVTLDSLIGNYVNVCCTLDIVQSRSKLLFTGLRS